MVDVEVGRTRGLVQSTEALRRKPELALMVAVLEDAIACYNGSVRARRENPILLRRQARLWFQSSDWKAPFSFNNICDALALDPVAVRNRILQAEIHGETAHAA